MAEMPVDIEGQVALGEHPIAATPVTARWKRRVSWMAAMALIIVIGLGIVTPAYAHTTIAKAVATMQAIGLDEPSDLGMIAIGVIGLILGRQSGLFLSRHGDKGIG